jgi:hypothetical protein
MSTFPTLKTSRRGFLGYMATGLGGIALAHLTANDGCFAAAQANPSNPNAARPPHFPAAAKNVVMIYCAGAVSHIDTFDYKPELVKRHGQRLPGSDKLVTFQGEQGNMIQPLWKFRPCGESGKLVSDLLPHLGELADDLCFIHSLTTKTNTHGPGENAMCTGSTLDGHPSIGAWVTYALGSANDNLPAFVAIADPRGDPPMTVNDWGSGFLPATFQGTKFNATKTIANLQRPAGISVEADAAWRGFLRRLNARHLDQLPGDAELIARINSYELAARMQLSVPKVTELSGEPDHTLKLYGADDAQNDLKAGFARNCILARRLVESGVRFIQLFNGSYNQGGEGVSNWDGHRMIKPQYDVHGRIMDQPVAGLLRDLKQRGLLDETLVVWCTEFGRMPTFQKGAEGRDHNPHAFTCWLAGAGVKAPFSHGATDEFGYKAIDNVQTVHDFHATILHLLGLDHEELTFYHNGLDRRLTHVEGHVIRDVLV